MCKHEKQDMELDTARFRNIKKYAYNLLEVLIRSERGDEYCYKLLREVKFPKDE
ncbi:MAG: hypothetical protein ACPKPY_09555 [Nitrososphaeraceae archaeon]